MNSSTGTASTQVAPVSSQVLPRTDVPNDFNQMMQLAEQLAKADDFLPARLRGKPGNVLAIMMRARALDIPLAVAWDELFVAKAGQMGQTAKLVRALARRAGHRIAYPSYDRFHAVALIQCKGETVVHEVRFTIQEAQAMGLTEPSPVTGKGGEQWHRQPENMLIARVTTRAVNRYCPEVMLGLGHELREAELDEPIEGVSSDLLVAHQEESRRKVAAVLRVAEEVDRKLEADGEVRLLALRELFLNARDNGVLDFAADDTGEYSVRAVITEKMMAADLQAKAQAAGEKPRPEVPEGAGNPAERAGAALEEIWASLSTVVEGETVEGPAEAEAPAEEPKKTARKRAAKKTAKAAEKPQEDSGEEAREAGEGKPRRARKTAAKKAASAKTSQSAQSSPAGRAADRPTGRVTVDEAAAGSGAEKDKDGRLLPCGCVVDTVISTGKHGTRCKEGR